MNYLFTKIQEAASIVSDFDKQQTEFKQQNKQKVEEDDFPTLSTLSNLTKTVLNMVSNQEPTIDDFNSTKNIDLNVPQINPPWFNHSDEIKLAILDLSTNKRNFITPPPDGTSFVFDIEDYALQAENLLNLDPLLKQMRFDLVPKEIIEEVFWKNYFYRVGLITASSTLTGSTNRQESIEKPMFETDILKNITFATVVDADKVKETTAESSPVLSEEAVEIPDDYDWEAEMAKELEI